MSCLLLCWKKNCFLCSFRNPLTVALYPLFRKSPQSPLYQIHHAHLLIMASTSSFNICCNEMFWKTHSKHAQNRGCCQLGPPSVCMQARQEYWGHCNQCESPHQTHLEDSKAYACVLFIAFSCAFNSIHLHLPVLKPSLEWNQIIKWFYSSLINRSQASQGYQLALCDQFYNIGVPQGCISFLILGTLYTSECRSQGPNNHYIKLSDDTIILSLLHWEDCPPGNGLF